jgi:hypothetical protein
MKSLLFTVILSIFMKINANNDEFEVSYGSSEIDESMFEFRSLVELVNKLENVRVKDDINKLIIEADNLIHKCTSTKDFVKPIGIQSKKDDHAKSKCFDPSPSEMMSKLVMLQFIFKDLSGVLDISSVQNVFKNYINRDISISDNPLAFGSKRCKDNYSNLTHLNELTICPWHTRIQIRENRYPYMITQSKCNCQNCLHLNTPNEDAVFKCMPVYKLIPALIRDSKCDASVGVYKWKPILERIAVTCVCSRSKEVLVATNL